MAQFVLNIYTHTHTQMDGQNPTVGNLDPYHLHTTGYSHIRTTYPPSFGRIPQGGLAGLPLKCHLGDLPISTKYNIASLNEY